EVTLLGCDLVGQDDVLLVDRGLGVVALHVAAERFHHPGVRIGHVDLALGRGRGLIRLRWSAQPPAKLVPVLSPVLLIGLIAAVLGGQVLLQTVARIDQSLRPRTGYCSRRSQAVLLELTLCFTQPLPPTPGMLENPRGIKRPVGLGRRLLAGLGILLALSLALRLQVTS